MNDLVCLARLDHCAIFQHQNAIRHLGHNGQIMGDIYGGSTLFADNALERLEHLDLGCHIKRGCRLIQDQQVRPAGHRHGSHKALKLPARNLMWKTGSDMFGIGQIKLLVKLKRRVCCRCRIRSTMPQRSLGHLLANADRRIETGRCGLRNIGHLAPAQAVAFWRCQRHDIAPVQDHLAPENAASGPREAHGRQ